jgi:hypothetical protein
MNSSSSMIHTLLFILIIAFASADFTGDWILKKATQNNDAVKFPKGVVTLSITSSGDDYNIFLKATNDIKGTMTVKGEVSETKAAVDFGDLRSTRMKPQPQFRDVERFLMDAVPKMKMAIKKDSGNLIWKGPDVLAIFTPSKGGK